MSFHEIHAKSITNDRLSARLREAEVYRLNKKNRPSFPLAAIVAKAAVAIRNAETSIPAPYSPAINDRRVL